MKFTPEYPRRASSSKASAKLLDLTAQRHFLPSELYAGGDPGAIPADLRPFFHLRQGRLTARVPGGCSPERLVVSGTGVTVTSTVRRPFGRCRITFQATAGETGDRDLIVRFRIGRPGSHRYIVLRTLRGVVHLADAIPVKPPFLK